MTAAAGRRSGLVGVIACTLLLAAFATASWVAVSGKSATYDETLHAPAAYAELRHRDFRANAEHPPLWKYWAALPWLAWPPADANVAGESYAAILESPPRKWDWAQQTMYGTPGNDPRWLLAMSRAMMLAVGVGLGAFLAWWAWRLGGAVAAVVTCGLYSLDPNFLAHAPLVTNDVAYTLAFAAVLWALWRVGERVTIGRVAWLAGLCGVAIGVKYTAVLLGPIVATVLIIRALMARPWEVQSRPAVSTRPGRLLVAAGIGVVCAVVAYGCVWGAYGFRAGFTPEPGVGPSFERKARGAVVSQIMGRTGRAPEPGEVEATRPAAFIHMVAWAHDHALVPEPFAYGLLTVYSTSSYHRSYLLGEVTGQGHWYYFPFAMLVKTPVATLASVIAATVALIVYRPRMADSGPPRQDSWLWVCLSVPGAIFFLAAMSSHLNIGVRHVLPVYPLLYLAAGVAAARLWDVRRRVAAWGVGVLGVAMAVESASAFPDYLAFFNAPAGGQHGGLRLLGDSNLDWGQDLPRLADWQRRNPHRTLYLAYFGTADPAYHGIRSIPLTLGSDTRVSRRVFPTTGVVAVSATLLQDNWPREEAKRFFSGLRDREPSEVLGGSIYVYDLGGQ